MTALYFHKRLLFNLATHFDYTQIFFLFKITNIIFLITRLNYHHVFKLLVRRLFEAIHRLFLEELFVAFEVEGSEGV